MANVDSFSPLNSKSKGGEKPLASVTLTQEQAEKVYAVVQKVPEPQRCLELPVKNLTAAERGVPLERAQSLPIPPNSNDQVASRIASLDRQREMR